MFLYSMQIVSKRNLSPKAKGDNKHEKLKSILGKNNKLETNCMKCQFLFSGEKKLETEDNLHEMPMGKLRKLFQNVILYEIFFLFFPENRLGISSKLSLICIQLLYTNRLLLETIFFWKQFA